MFSFLTPDGPIERPLASTARAVAYAAALMPSRRRPDPPLSAAIRASRTQVPSQKTWPTLQLFRKGPQTHWNM